MAQEYIFAKGVDGFTYYSKTVTKAAFGASISGATNSDGLTVAMGASADITLAGFKVSNSTPLMLSVGLSLNLSWEWSGGLDFKYTGIGAEADTAKDDSALASTQSKLAELNNKITRMTNHGIDFSVRAIDDDANGVSIR